MGHWCALNIVRNELEYSARQHLHRGAGNLWWKWCYVSSSLWAVWHPPLHRQTKLPRRSLLDDLCHTITLCLILHFVSELPTQHLQIGVPSFKNGIVRESYLGLGEGGKNQILILSSYWFVLQTSLSLVHADVYVCCKFQNCKNKSEYFLSSALLTMLATFLPRSFIFLFKRHSNIYQ